MKGLFFYSVLFSLTLLYNGCGSRQKEEVVVIEKTKSYHTHGCPLVNMAQTRVMTIAEARAMNCKPCPGCRPDSSLAGKPNGQL